VNTIRVSAALASLEDVARYVLDLAQRAGMSPDASYRLRLAADELATNVVMHGYRQSEGELRLAGGMDDETVWIRLEDDAPPFDPRDGRLSLDTEAPLTERPVGGLGIHLALSALDDFDHTYADGHNTSTLVVRRHGHDGNPDK
jgi:serine/threonine-protein kinase RsbW